MKQVLLRFDFKGQSQASESIQFTQPNKIFTTHSVDEVKPLLQALETELSHGKYLAGYLSYEAAQAFVAEYQTGKVMEMPLIWFASFDQPEKVKDDRDESSYNLTSWQPISTYQDYQANIQAIKDAIQKGDTSQVNYTTRLTSQFSGDTLAFYQQLLENQQASYSAYLDIGRFQVLSASPELFFKVDRDQIMTKPMKGTMKRGRTLAEDLAHQQHLIQSEKERTENLMIVDILKNDLKKIAVAGSVKTPKLLTVETYPTVHQMTSTVTATLKENSRMIDWFEALFPCGSITGAPRLRTMMYIDQLEATPREVYCGAIGYVTPERKAIFNVPIRTVVIDQKNDSATYGVGGGITSASETESEYAEVQAKAAFLTKRKRNFSLLESLLLTKGTYPYLAYHLERIEQSAQYFAYSYKAQVLKQKLEQFATNHLTGNHKVRLLLDKNGEIELNSAKLTESMESVTTYIAKKPVDIKDPFLYHKTTVRDQYQTLSIDQQDNFATLLWNENDQLTEFTIGNLVLKIGDQYLTPPIDSGLLAGTFRQYLLNQNQIKEQIIMKGDLNRADEIWLINAVRGWVKVKEVL
ncbi:aminodeoxychorismate synthase component I [Amphibacillus sp. Q70]|uniref:aminodeoxychorismate synthase component I n=1 Tax=Amphibacillus sp. Q70 TaxID=3453416 RepID=UPI003F8565A3